MCSAVAGGRKVYSLFFGWTGRGWVVGGRTMYHPLRLLPIASEGGRGMYPIYLSNQTSPSDADVASERADAMHNASAVP